MSSVSETFSSPVNRGRATPSEIASRISALFSDDPPSACSSSVGSTTTAVPTPSKDMIGFDFRHSGARSTPKVDDGEAEAVINRQEKHAVEGTRTNMPNIHPGDGKNSDFFCEASQPAISSTESSPREETESTSQPTDSPTITARSSEPSKPKSESAVPPHRRPRPPQNENENVRKRDTYNTRGINHASYYFQNAQHQERHDDNQIVRIPLSVLKQLQYKAQLYDRLVAPSVQAPGPENRATISNLPPAQTLTIKGLPKDINMADMIHSVSAPGGIRYIRVIDDPTGKFKVVVITFCTESAAEAYARYVSKYGFFASRRVLEDTTTGPGETLLGIQLGGQLHGNQGGIKRFWVLKSHVPGVELVLPSKAPGDMNDDSHINDIEAEIKAGATRSIRFKGEAKEVARELEMFAEGGAVVVEGLSYFQTQKDGQITVVRFGGIGDAIIVRRYFGLRKGWEGRVDGAKDVCDKNVDTLGWENLNRLEDGEPANWVGGLASGSNLIELTTSVGTRSDLIDMSSKVSEI